jgi:glutaconate CoA-transferase subunit A
MRVNPGLRSVSSPYGDGWPFGGGGGGAGGGGDGTTASDRGREEFVAMPALRMDAALVHVNRADRLGNGQYLGPDPYFDDVFCEAADAAYVSCERIVDTAELTKEAAPQTLLIKRHTVAGVVEAPNGAHFTSCAPDHDRDEAFQRHYATTEWARFAERFLAGDEHAYQSAVRAWHKERS